MKKLVSLVMVVIMLSAVCATAMAEVYPSFSGKWFSKSEGYVLIYTPSGAGTIKWMNDAGYVRSGYIFETKGSDLPMLAVFATDSYIEVYLVTAEHSADGGKLTLQQVGGRAPEENVTQESYSYTFNEVSFSE